MSARAARACGRSSLSRRDRNSNDRYRRRYRRLGRGFSSRRSRDTVRLSSRRNRFRNAAAECTGSIARLIPPGPSRNGRAFAESLSMQSRARFLFSRNEWDRSPAFLDRQCKWRSNQPRGSRARPASDWWSNHRGRRIADRDRPVCLWPRSCRREFVERWAAANFRFQSHGESRDEPHPIAWALPLYPPKRRFPECAGWTRDEYSQSRPVPERIRFETAPNLPSAMSPAQDSGRYLAVELWVVVVVVVVDSQPVGRFGRPRASTSLPV